MAKTVAEMKGVEVYAVAARDLERARVFAQKYEVKKAYGSYEEMLADDEVELVYIATPHSHHYLHAKMCLEAGKHVLCEKAFTVNAEQAQKLFDLAKEKKLLITEAIWTRYMPSRKMINDIIESGVIGEVTAVTANLSYTVSHVERIRKPELAGGALLDVGVYPINFASMVLGDKVKDVKATAIFQNGVDILDSIAMVFEGDCMATLQCGAREISDRMGSIFGTRGYMQVQNINNPAFPRCEQRITFPPSAISFLIVGRAATSLFSSVISPFFNGTLKSHLQSTRLPLTLISSTDFLFNDISNSS